MGRYEDRGRALTEAERNRRRKIKAAAVRREREVLDMVESGVSQSEVARRLGISRQRVSQLIQRAKVRLGG